MPRARRRAARCPGRPQSPPGRSGPVRLQSPALEGRDPGRRGGPRENDRGRAGACPEMDGGQPAHPGHHAGQPAQAVVAGDRGKILPADAHPGSKNYNRTGEGAASRRPFEQKALVICSFQFAARNADELMVIPWDLVVIDEAHRLRNVYRPDNRIGQRAQEALANAPKLLLTATPLQNSLMELYGLVSLIDDYTFGDAKSFRAQYARISGDEQFDELKDRLEAGLPSDAAAAGPGIHPLHQPHPDHAGIRADEARAGPLRHGVGLSAAAIAAGAAVQPAHPDDADHAQAARVIDLRHRRRPRLRSRASWSASFATTRTSARSSKRKSPRTTRSSRKLPTSGPRTTAEPELLTADDIGNIEQEIADLRGFRDLAVSIAENAKGQALLSALRAGLRQGRGTGRRRRRPSSSPSPAGRRTISSGCSRSNGYDGKLVLFNGSNTDPTLQGDLCRRGSSATRAPTASPAPAPPTCARRSSTISARRPRS